VRDLEAEYWQSRVKITQIPLEIDSVINTDSHTGRQFKAPKSILLDPFLDQTQYGLELQISNGFMWTFFFRELSKEEALFRGFSFLRYMELQFPGLSGDVEAIPLTSSLLNRKHYLFELDLPRLPKPFSIIEKFTHLFRKSKVGEICLYLFWQKDDSCSLNVGKIYDGVANNLFRFKVYLRYNPPLLDERKDAEEMDRILIQFKSFLDYLTTDIRNAQGERFYFKLIESANWERILNSRVMFQNLNYIQTGAQYKYYYENIEEEMRFAFVNPEEFDFSFPDSCPILRANALRLKNVEYLPIQKDNPNYIWIGNILDKGIPESNYSLIPIDHFAKSVIIGGKPGTGKTYLLRQMSIEFYDKAPEIGVLYLNFGKGNQEKFYKTDRTIKYGDKDFIVPYWVEGDYLDKGLQETATYLTASLGLREPVDKVLKNVMESFRRVNGTLPDSLTTLFKGLRKWYREHKYHEKYQTNILTAIDNRVLSLLSEKDVENTLKLTKNSIPQWFKDWRNGKKIMLDISMCSIYLKLLIANAIFQMVRGLTPDFDVGRLQHLIVIDEAQQLFEIPKDYFTNTDAFITKEQLENIFNNLIREFRSKGLGFIIATVIPSNLFYSATKMPSLKILFNLDEECIKRFTSALDDRNFLMLLKVRRALVLNGNNSDRYAIQTVGFDSVPSNELVSSKSSEAW
jgi:hypothetical protein